MKKCRMKLLRYRMYGNSAAAYPTSLGKNTTVLNQMHTTSLFSCLVPLGAALGDGRKSQVRGTTNERRAVCSETRMSSTEDVVALKFCWSPTRLYRRVERVGTIVEPPTIDGGESQKNKPMWPSMRPSGAA